jgi:nicotinate-nucleotide pyrophosphorylase (carboxylating)
MSFFPVYYLLKQALKEDLGDSWCDVTTEILFSNHQKIGKAYIISKHPEPIVICGIQWVELLFKMLSSSCKIHSNYRDGELLEPGEILLFIEGDASALLKGERTALNFLRHLCAIATLTAKYIRSVQHTGLKILDTRKTTPNLRHLEKYAVSCGGGVNHRMGLYDAIMVKDTHIDLLGGMKHTMMSLPNLDTHSLPVIVEVRTREELESVLNFGRNKVHRVLLDNMSPDLIRDYVSLCRGIYETEASGNIHLSNIVEIAETGVDYASVGELTYGAGQVDLSMKSDGLLEP